MKSDLYPTEAIHMFAVLITWTSIIAGICFKSQKSIFNRRLLLLAIIIIGGYGFRLFVWQTGESSYYDYSYLFYCFLPLSVSLLVESAIKRPVSLFTKIVVSFTPLILISGIILSTRSELWWKTTYSLTILYACGLLIVSPLIEIKNAASNHARSVLYSLALFGFLAAILGTLDIISSVIPAYNVKLSAFAVIVFGYMMADVISPNSSYCARILLKKVVLYFTSSIIFVYLLSFLGLTLSNDNLIKNSLIIFSLIILIDIQRIIFIETQQLAIQVIEKNRKLGSKDPQIILDEIKSWKEIEDATFISSENLQNHGISLSRLKEK